MILTETNITDQYYWCSSLGYDVVCLQMRKTEAEVAQGEVRLVIQDQTQGWSIEATNFHELNLVRCKFITNGQCNPIIGTHLRNPTLEHLPDLEEALTHLRD